MARKTRIKNSFKQNYLIISGLLLISVFLVWRYHQVRILSFNTSEVAKISNIGLKPVHIKSYPIGIDVEIKPAVISKGVWPIFPDTAGYVTNENNIIIYGHNKNDILGPLRWIKEGALVEILDNAGQTHKYEVVKTDTVEPDNLSYIFPSTSELLTIYTCTGFLDSKRFIVVAERVK